MKAILLNEHGGSEGFSVDEIPEPEAWPGHVLVKMAASSVNPVDYKIRQGLLLPVGPLLPGILHGDMAGTITQVGEGVETFEAGDEVYGCVGGFKESTGVLSEYVLARCPLSGKKAFKPIHGRSCGSATCRHYGMERIDRPGQGSVKAKEFSFMPQLEESGILHFS